MSILRDIFGDFLDMIYPSKLECLFCGSRSSDYNDLGLCKYCMSILPYLSGNICSRCGRPIHDTHIDKECRRQIENDHIVNGGYKGFIHSEYLDNITCECYEEILYFDAAVSVFEFTGIIQAALYKLKYDGIRETASALGILMARRLLKEGWDIDIIVPIPLHNQKYCERGFNQSYLLAAAISRENSIDMSHKILSREKYTKSQTTLSKFQRIQNVRGAFEVNNNILIKGRSVLLIDDIMTTGATLNEGSRILKANNAKNVYCLTAACPYKLK